MTIAKGSIQRQQRPSVIRKGLGEFLPTSVQKSYFLLSNAEREVLNSAFEKYQPGKSEPILVGGNNLLKPALRLMSDYRVVLEEVKGAELVTTYTRWLETVQVRGVDDQEVYLTFSPRFERIWLESKKRLPEYVAKNPANIGLRSRYALRLYGWAKRYVEAGTKSISLGELRKVLGLESIKDEGGNVIQEPPLPIWANFRQRALDVAIMEINKKTDLRIKLSSIERSKHRRVVALTFAIKTQPAPKRRTP